MINIILKDFKSSYDSLRWLFFMFRISLSKSELRAFYKVKIISNNYDIDMPEELIKGVKYYANHNSTKAPNFSYEVRKFPDPNIHFDNTIGAIDDVYDKKVYLKWLIEKLPTLPVPGTFKATEYKFYCNYYTRAIKCYSNYSGFNLRNSLEKNKDISKGQTDEKCEETHLSKIQKKAINYVVNGVRKKDACREVLIKYAKLKNTYPGKSQNAYFVGDENFDGINNMIGNGTYYRWTAKFEKCLDDLKSS